MSSAHPRRLARPLALLRACGLATSSTSQAGPRRLAAAAACDRGDGALESAAREPAVDGVDEVTASPWYDEGVAPIGRERIGVCVAAL